MRTLLRMGVLARLDANGDVDGAGSGLFTADTRHLSRWRLRVDGDDLVPLLTDDGPDRVRSMHDGPDRVRSMHDGPDRVRSVLVRPLQRGVDAPYTVGRDQTVHGTGLTERVTVHNHLDRPVEVEITYEVEADFVDLFDVRAERSPGTTLGTHRSDHAPGYLCLRYDREDLHRRTVVRSDPPAAVTADPAGHLLRLVLPVAPLGTGTAWLTVEIAEARPDPPPLTAPRAAVGPLRDAVARGVTDLTALLIGSPTDPAGHVVAAGSPWFLTLFGRDSLLASVFAASSGDNRWLAASTLRTLAALQGRTVDPARVEEPGKILHELRVGELSHFGDVPFGRYYGTVDATPLFLMLLARLDDDHLAAELEPAARAAVAWMFDFGGLERTGYLVYRTDGPGLVHHCWKDSPRGICFRSGEAALGELAVCEVQGYAYEALRGTAELARRVWRDPGYAARLTTAADRLRARFHDDFWMPEEGFVALARTEDGRQVDALASNAGHLLWTGMLDPERAVRVGRRLAGPDFFSGWGIRTLAAGQPAYHPVSYHNGSVWPHDTAIAVAGLARCGLRDEAATVADGLLAVAAHHGGRLPEVLTGFARDEQFPHPVPYPHSCSPQAWAAAAPLLIADALDARPSIR